MSFTREDLKKSEESVGQIYPVLLDKQGDIIDGFHRKFVNPDWKEEVLDTDDPLEILKIRVHAQYRRNVPASEKKEWVKECRKLLKKMWLKGTQQEIADQLGMARTWVTKYDEEPTRPIAKGENRMSRRDIQSNVWGLKNGKIMKGDPDQPDSQFHHGSTPGFVIENLVELYKPSKVLDSMAGVGATKYVCDKHPEIVEKVDQFDINPWLKGDVKEGDAENPPTNETYNLVFNHVPYWGMVKYSTKNEDLSTLKLEEFLSKMKRVFLKNYELLEANGIYSILVGDWRHGGKIIPLTAYLTLMGIECGFTLFDIAVKLTAEQKGKQLQEYRARKGGYMPQNYDTVLIFKKR